MKSPITTHVLDVAKGCPAAGIKVELEKENAGAWKKLGEGITNADGRVADLLATPSVDPGLYRLTFHSGAYHKNTGFYPYVSIAFRIDDARQHYHVPILLSPFGFTTYRGS